MSDIYEKYAKDVYATVFENLKSALHSAGKKSVLVVSGEAHDDPPGEIIKNIFTDDTKEKPAANAAYAHIAAMIAGAKLVGPENLIVSIEAPPERIKEIVKLLDSGREPEEIGLDRNKPMQYALYYAYQHGFKIVGTDSGSAEARKKMEEWFPSQKSVDEAVGSEERLGAERNDIAKLASQAKIVVHLGGAGHIPSLYGHKMNEDFTKPDSPQMTHHSNPMLKHYGRVVFFNSADKEDDLTSSFYTSSRNAIQFTAPGAMSPYDRTHIGRQVKEAAAEITPSLPEPIAPGPKR